MDDGPDDASISVPLLIYDGDLGPDPCDFTTLSMLHEYHSRAQIELIGVIGSTPDPYLATTFSIYNEIYGNDIPIGAYKEDTHDVSYDEDVMGWYAAAVLLSTSSNQNEVIFDKYGSDQTASPDDAYGSVELYRKLLSEAEDFSVTVFVAGQLFNLPDLIESQADQYSSMTGEQLLALKVERFIFMGGYFPTSSEQNLYPFTSGAEWNWWALGAKDLTRTAIEAIAEMNRPMTYIGHEVGAAIRVGQEIVDRLGRNHPTSEAYFQYNPTNSRDGNTLSSANPAYDDVALYYLVEGGIDQFFVEVFGNVQIDENGANTWIGNGTQESYLTLMPGVAGELADRIVDRITGEF